MTFKLRACPVCGKKGWYKSRDGFHRCRYCGYDDAAKVAAKKLQKTLDRGHKSLGRTIDKERNK